MLRLYVNTVDLSRWLSEAEADNDVLLASALQPTVVLDSSSLSQQYCVSTPTFNLQ